MSEFITSDRFGQPSARLEVAEGFPLWVMDVGFSGSCLITGTSVDPEALQSRFGLSFSCRSGGKF